MKIKQTLFPLKTAKIKGYTPRVEVVLQKNMRAMDFIMGAEEKKEDEDRVNRRLKEKRRQQDQQKK